MSMISDVIGPWSVVSATLDLNPIRDDYHYERLGAAADELAERAAAEGEESPLWSLMEVIGDRLKAWEDAHHPWPAGEPREVLAYLMQAHGLRQSDLPELGSQGVVSELLSGKRELNTRQIRALAERFHVSPSTFI